MISFEQKQSKIDENVRSRAIFILGCSGDYVKVTIPEINNKIHDHRGNGRLKAREFAKAASIQNERVHILLHQHFIVESESRLLTVYQSRYPMTCFKESSQFFQYNPQEFYCHLVSVDDTCFHYYTVKAPYSRFEFSTFVD